MADEADIANDRIELEMSLTMKARRQEKRFSVDCVECGEYIPQARQQATGGTDMCIDCASMEGRL